MEDFFVMMLIVWAVGILSIILFFKLWRMTNDIKKICISVVKEPQRGRNWVVSTMLMKGESPEMISKYHATEKPVSKVRSLLRMMVP